jgi:hypothetical protein
VPIPEIVSQISPPLRILIAGAFVFLALWFTLLRPKSSDTSAPVAATPTPPTGNVNTGAPAVTGLGKVVQKAKTTVAGAEASARAAAGEGTATATATPATGSATGSATKSTPAPQAAAVAIPADVLAKLPTDVAGALTARKVLVLGVISDDAKPWRPIGDDDRYVGDTLAHLNRYGGDVFVKQVPLGQLATYGPLVNDLGVNQTPSVVVIDRDLKAEVLTGYVDAGAIDQTIADARDRSTNPRISDPYLRRLDDVCGQYFVRIDRWSLPTVSGQQAFNQSLARGRTIFAQYRGAVARIPAPAKWRGLKRQFVRVMDLRVTGFRKGSTALRHNDLAGAVNAVQTFDFAQVRKLDHRFDVAGVTGCSIGRAQ